MKIEITELESAKITTEIMYKIKSSALVQSTVNGELYYTVYDQKSTIGYFYSNHDGSILVNGASIDMDSVGLPGELPLPQVFYKVTCESLLQEDKSTLVKCTFAEKHSSVVIEKSWRLRIIQ